MTVQGVPEGVEPPVVTALSSSLLNITWSEPKHPGGFIERYHLNQTGVGTIFTHNGGPKSYTVTGKSPSLFSALCNFNSFNISKPPDVGFFPVT